MDERINPIIEAESEENFKFLKEAYNNLSDYINLPDLPYRVKGPIGFRGVSIEIEPPFPDIEKLNFLPEQVSKIETIATDFKKNILFIKTKDNSLSYFIHIKKEDKKDKK